MKWSMSYIISIETKLWEAIVLSMNILLRVVALFLHLFNIIFNSWYFPDHWSEGIIIPLHMKNDPDDVNNYRGITLVSCFSKIFTGILNRRLSYFCENNEILYDAQFGFRPKRSTTDASFVLLSLIQRVCLKINVYMQLSLILKKRLIVFIEKASDTL